MRRLARDVQNRVGSPSMLLQSGDGFLRRHDNQFDLPMDKLVAEKLRKGYVEE